VFVCVCNKIFFGQAPILRYFVPLYRCVVHPTEISDPERCVKNVYACPCVHVCVCMHVRVCARARARARVRVCLRAFLYV